MALVGVWPDQAPTHPPTHPPPRASGAGDDSGRVRAPAGLGGGGAWRRRGGTERRRGVKATPRLRPVIFPPRQCAHPYSLQALPQQQRSAHAHHRSPRVPVLPPPQPPPWAREAPGMSRTRWACGAGPSGTRARIAPRCGGGLDGWPAQSARHTAHAREGGGGAAGRRPAAAPPRRCRPPPACLPQDMATFLETGTHPELERARAALVRGEGGREGCVSGSAHTPARRPAPPAHRLPPQANTVPPLPERSKLRQHVFLTLALNNQPLGKLVVELFDDIAPVAVAHFRNRCSGGRVGRGGCFGGWRDRPHERGARAGGSAGEQPDPPCVVLTLAQRARATATRAPPCTAWCRGRGSLAASLLATARACT